MSTDGGGRAHCGLCGAAADVHCAADRAFLCSACDGEVHGANLLAACHRRTRVSAPAPPPPAAARPRVSATGSATATATTTRQRVDALMQGWARRMGVAAWPARRSAVAARRALLLELTPVAPRMPLRVGMAGALWRQVAPRCDDVPHAVRVLRRLEECAHVPARLIVAVALSIGRRRRVRVVVRRNRP